MDDKHVDREIKESLLKNTDHTSKQKEDLWKNIESRLALGEESRRNVAHMEAKQIKIEQSKRKSKNWITGTIAAAVLIGIFTTATDTGQAFVNNVKELFAPEKQVIREIEGMPEEQEVVLNEGKAGYIIYIDEERYTLIEEESLDRIVLKEKLDDMYPEVSMSIEQVADKTPAELAAEISAELKKSFTTVKEVESVTNPVDGLLISAINGDEWDSLVTEVYIVSNEKEGSFIIQQNYFLEASEGHGLRFNQMLKEFTILENTEK
jgi:hypothetical protein